MPNKKDMKKMDVNKLDLKMSPNKITPTDVLQLVNNQKVVGSVYALMMVSIFAIVFVSSIIFYLNSLRDCNCFEEKNENNYTNLHYLVTIESIILALNIIIVLGCIFVIFVLKDLKSGGGNSESGSLLSYYIIFIIYILLYGYFIYYVYKLYQNVDENCDCTQNWLRYLLYFQTILMIIQIIIVIFSAVM